MNLITKKFAEAKSRPLLIVYIMAGDDDISLTRELLPALQEAGADIIEIGFPFTDPIADGPVIQAAAQRALKSGQTLAKTLEVTAEFKSRHATPVIIMGYLNPILSYCVDRFVKDAKSSGVDGLLIVDTPAEEDETICLPAIKSGLNFIRMTSPTTDKPRFKSLLKNSSGFIYYASLLGVTGGQLRNVEAVSLEISMLRRETDLPIVVGFGLKSVADIQSFGLIANGVVVGSALVNIIHQASLSKKVEKAKEFVTNLRNALNR